MHTQLPRLASRGDCWGHWTPSSRSGGQKSEKPEAAVRLTQTAVTMAMRALCSVRYSENPRATRCLVLLAVTGLHSSHVQTQGQTQKTMRSTEVGSIRIKVIRSRQRKPSFVCEAPRDRGVEPAVQCSSLQDAPLSWIRVIHSPSEALPGGWRGRFLLTQTGFGCLRGALGGLWMTKNHSSGPPRA